MKDVSPMSQYVIWAMEGRGKMSLADIYREVEKWSRRFLRFSRARLLVVQSKIN
jgi:hypothetical protein